MRKELNTFEGEHADGRPPTVLAQAVRFLRSVHAELRSKSELFDFANKSLYERDAGRPGGQEKIADAISVKSRTRPPGFGGSMVESLNGRNSCFEIDRNVKMDSLGTETKPPDMEGTKPLPSRIPSPSHLSQSSDKLFEAEPRSNPTHPSPVLQQSPQPRWQ